MRTKFFARELPAINADKLKPNGFQEKGKEFDQIKDSLKHLTECIIQMTHQIKEMKSQSLKTKEQGSIGKKEKNQIIYEDGTPVNSRMQRRFQDVDLPIPTLIEDHDDKQRRQDILGWLTKVCKSVFSVGFNLYESGVLDINKVKAYCSENVIRNLINFCRKNGLSPEQLSSINRFMESGLLPYFCQKYPESEQAETSATFSSGLIERDDMDNNEYDLVYKSKVDFSYQESGNYNSQIMKFLNYIISLPNKTIPSSELKDKKQKPLNDLFLADMESIFRMVELQNNTLNMQKYNPKNPVEFVWTKDESSDKQKQEYKDKVRLYTSFLIGQKLSKNFKPFSDLEIQSGNLTLKSSEMIRVLTKWCEELQKCYDQRYLLDRETPFRISDGSQKYLSKRQNKFITSHLRDMERTYVEPFRQEIRKNNNRNQSILLKQETYPELVNFSEGQAAVGQFSSAIFQNNTSYLIKYLNVLIHGINKSIHQYSTQYNFSNGKLPQLITFSIGDLMRCKCSSKENEIIALYKEIERRHKQPDSGIKIIRVKNRLNRGNKDILMNLLYRGQMVVEMQLAIKSDKSKFIECSYNFNHYLYELKRAQFGPIMQMCNVWISKDLKSKFYLQHTQNLNIRTKTKSPEPKKTLSQNLQSCCSENKKYIQLPFRCSLCDCFYFSSSMLEKNIQCRKCGTFSCYLCQLELLELERGRFFKEIPNFQGRDIQFKESIGEKDGGVLINLKSKKKKPVTFITSLYKNTYYMFDYDLNKNQLKLRQKFSSPNLPQSFLKQNLLLTSQTLQKKTTPLLTLTQQPLTNYFTSTYLKQAHKTQKVSISIKGQNLGKDKLEIGGIGSWGNVRRLDLSENFGVDMGVVVGKFPNVELAVLNYVQFQKNGFGKFWEELRVLEFKGNKVDNLDFLTNCKKLTQLNLSFTSIQTPPQSPQFLPQTLTKLLLTGTPLPPLPTFPTLLPTLTNLQQLELNNTKLQHLPKQIGNLKQLRKLNVERNLLVEVPGEIGALGKLEWVHFGGNLLGGELGWVGELVGLREMYLGENKIEMLPESIGKLANLQILDISMNQLQILPTTISTLPSLKKLTLSQNSLPNLPTPTLPNPNLTTLPFLPTLTQLHLPKNNLTTLPQNLGQISHLRTIILTSNNLEQLPQSIGNLKELECLDVGGNRLQGLPENFCGLGKLRYGNFRGNGILGLPAAFGELEDLELVVLDGNLLEGLPESFGNLRFLQLLHINNNKLKSLPESFGQLHSLKQLQLSSNNLQNLPESFSNLSTLTHLSLSKNSLQSLPKSFGNYPQLTHLSLSNNRLQQLPPSLALLKSVSSVDLSYNSIGVIPDWVGDLGKLVRVDFQGNLVEGVPRALMEIGGLAYLNFSIMGEEFLFPEGPFEKTSSYLNISISYLPEYIEIAQRIQKIKNNKISISIRPIK